MKAEQRFSIARASAGDVVGILQCLQEAFEPYRQSYTPEGFLDTVLTPETLQQRLLTMSIFVARDSSDAIVGTIGCNRVNTHEGHIRGMAVKAAWQGCGIAQQLLKAAESELETQGCKRVTLDTTAPLERAISFYKKHGYRDTGKVTDFFGMPLYEYAKDLDLRKL
jgi:ribosomal protein S18 acetylase RimI-like enzyme